MGTIAIPADRITTAEEKAAKAAAELKATFQSAIEAHVDQVARARNFRHADSARGHANSTVPAWKADADAFIAWADDVWLYAFTELAKVEAGERAVPEVEDFLAELPVIEWPATAET